MNEHIKISGKGVDWAEDSFMDLVNLEVTYETGDDTVERGISKRIDTLKRRRGILVDLQGYGDHRGGSSISKNDFIRQVYQSSNSYKNHPDEWIREMYLGTQEQIAKEIQYLIHEGLIEIVDINAPATDDPTEILGGSGRVRSMQIELEKQQMMAAQKDGTLFEKYPHLKEKFDEFLRDRGLDPDSPDFDDEFHRRLDNDDL